MFRMHCSLGADGSARAGDRVGPALRSDCADAGPRRLHILPRCAHVGREGCAHTQHTGACQVAAVARYAMHDVD